LDEPTIGLDLMAKERIQDFLKKVNEEKKITIILTTHNLDDVEKLCKRVVFIDKGKVLFDGSSVEMVNRFGGHRYLVVDTSNWNETSWRGTRVARSEGNRLWFKIEDDSEVADMVRMLSDMLDIHNLTVQEPKMEDIMRQLYARTEVSLPN
jgi:ABC-2 type transport system ATP-binding protein